MIINHGIPVSNYFLIALPYNGEPMGNKVKLGTPQDPFVQATLKDPKTGQVTLVEIHDSWRFDAEQAALINAFSKLAYGVTGPQLISVLEKRKGSVIRKIEFLLLMKLE